MEQTKKKIKSMTYLIIIGMMMMILLIYVLFESVT